ncbi:uncharacterized protein Z519_04981 [Cladophialophora bantiana CBS 173.52]|uniref:Extracellular membrane protein CFEM domain-containing protein n=1 Tax=Cladophialophora bantiana (strain ATCC 10958 / CBS 173.52 / CDC B-1940 / NIH 8579) TaxID=1442370 RepID=A0A0D2EYH6_CLAB1|nr:uncharacterized protein Z519_04981 [Cladophialophora bantiana CBS 173.52]KIW95001.1 hypothetical protein Z519_04981 [Cladophialophora bantiana CBS 173.52]
MRYSLLSAMALAVASVSASLVYPVSFPVYRRQEPGTPEYDCHANCGAVIVAGRTEGYCDTGNFTTALKACLDCALEFDIWQYYGDSVAEAATACGLDATPVPANATSATNSSSIPESTLVSSPQSTEATSSTSTTASSVETASATAGQTFSETPSETASTATATETGNFGNRIAFGGGHVALPLVALLPGFV